MQAECLDRLGRPATAIAVYEKALKLTPASDAEWWDRARGGLYGLLGVE